MLFLLCSISREASLCSRNKLIFNKMEKQLTCNERFSLFIFFVVFVPIWKIHFSSIFFFVCVVRRSVAGVWIVFKVDDRVSKLHTIKYNTFSRCFSSFMESFSLVLFITRFTFMVPFSFVFRIFFWCILCGLFDDVIYRSKQLLSCVHSVCELSSRRWLTTLVAVRTTTE